MCKSTKNRSSSGCPQGLKIFTIPALCVKKLSERKLMQPEEDVLTKDKFLAFLHKNNLLLDKGGRIKYRKTQAEGYSTCSKSPPCKSTPQERKYLTFPPFKNMYMNYTF